MCLKIILIGVCLDLGAVNEYNLRGDEAVPAQEPGGFCHEFFRALCEVKGYETGDRSVIRGRFAFWTGYNLPVRFLLVA